MTTFGFVMILIGAGLYRSQCDAAHRLHRQAGAPSPPHGVTEHGAAGQADDPVGRGQI